MNKKNTAIGESLSLVGGIRSAMELTPSKVAITDSGSTRTYSELIARIDQVSMGFLAHLNLTGQAHAAIVSGNSIEYVEVIAGASQAGVPLATINPQLSAAEITAICDDALAQVLFTDLHNSERLLACTFSSVKKIIVFGPDFESWMNSIHSTGSFPNVSADDVFTIPYTSGTTGRPKGVLVSHRSRIMTFHGMAAEYGCYTAADRFLAIAPLCHGAGLAFALASLFFGGYVQLINRFDAKTVLSILHENNITGVFMVPTHFHKIFDLEPETLARYQGTQLGSIISNAAPLPHATKEQILEYFGPDLLHETYGSTEASIVSNLRPKDQRIKQNCVGLPFNSNLISLRNEQGEECGVDEPGELFSSSPYLFNGYWNNPDETKAAFNAGWVTVGDIARRDADGYLYIIDRKKDMVLSGGINIYPREIENVLEQHPDIVEAAVIGVPDEKWGERLKAFVVPSHGELIVPEQLASFVETLLAKYKVPREYQAIRALPRNAGGKLLKGALREMA
jgi:long-chain acyl-CoA synthetase